MKGNFRGSRGPAGFGVNSRGIGKNSGSFGKKSGGWGKKFVVLGEIPTFLGGNMAQFWILEGKILGNFEGPGGPDMVLGDIPKVLGKITEILGKIPTVLGEIPTV